jgi:molecular chaperone HscC
MSIIGIDLGTTNSLVAICLDGKPVIVPNSLGDKLTPSIVSVLNKNEIITGKAAKERLITHPHLTAGSFKRYMGTNKIYSLGNYNFTPVELSSFIMKSLKADAEAYLGTTVTEAVISVPAYFNDVQRRATKQAGELAGLSVERLINEPTAAAVAYGLYDNAEEKHLLVFDLGGGTFDVSILEIFGNIMEVRAVSGNNYLGGDDFNQCIIDYFIKKTGVEKDKLDLKTLSHISKQAEICKRSLVKDAEAHMSCFIGKTEHTISLSNDKFESICYELLAEIRRPLQHVIRDSVLKLDEIDEIVLVGGSTKMHAIRSYVAKLFGRLPLCHLNPDEVVALGTGIYAAIKERNEAFVEAVVTDVCPFTLGTEVVAISEFGGYESGHFFPIIERNTVIPYSKVERLYSIADNQSQIKISIYQGESRLVKNNIKLGEIVVNIVPAPAGQSSVDVRYTYDINGILEVEVTSLTTGETKREVIVNEDCLLTKEEIEQRFKELAEIKIHPRDNTKNQYLLAKAERLYEESLSDLRMRIAHEINIFEAVLDRQKPIEIKKAVSKFEAFLESIDLSGDII